MGHCGDPEEGGVRETLREALAWVLAFWVGVPSIDLETPLGSSFVNTDWVC